ncbi:MAG: M20/M25/M40 family metallo-hydrolase [Oligoflexia bacterium]|nr:M20/M25/M40 family metallo-hydrolase [Oligoflexia bacterium]
MEIAAIKDNYSREKERFIRELHDYVRLDSISTDPAYEINCRNCAEWLVRHLNSIGLHSELWETNSKPVVSAHWKGQKGKPHVLIYGHYDVQPVVPLEEWKTKPFEPAIDSGRLYGRGSADNKGPTFSIVKAIETLIRAGELTCPLTLIVEGEEECGSEGLTEKLPVWQERLKADILLLADCSTYVEGVPGLTLGLRAVVGLEVRLGGIKNDLHSGMHGGVVKNPATELCRMVASLHDAQGRVLVPGFYDGVREITPDIRREANKVPCTEKQYEKMIGVPPLGGEAGFSMNERRGLRPCIDVNGIHSGYGGPGGKTIIPAHAIAKLTARLVPDQEPGKVLAGIEQYLRSKAPTGLNLEMIVPEASGKALCVSPTLAPIAKAAAVIEECAGHRPVMAWEGGSIPVVSELVAVTGAVPVLLGLFMDQDNLHAPNESFLLEHFRQGYLFTARFLSTL